MSRKLPHRGLLYASLIVGMVLGAEAAHAAIIATDDVEVDNYTYTGAIAQGPNLRDSGDQGLTAQAGTKFMSLSQSGAQNPGPGTLVLNGGFGPGTPIQAGTYQVTVLAGEGNIDRQTWTSFDVFLRTLGGIELPDRSVITPFVNPNTPTTAEWIPTTVQYIVPSTVPWLESNSRGARITSSPARPSMVRGTP